MGLIECTVAGCAFDVPCIVHQVVLFVDFGGMELFGMISIDVAIAWIDLCEFVVIVPPLIIWFQRVDATIGLENSIFIDVFDLEFSIFLPKVSVLLVRILLGAWDDCLRLALSILRGLFLLRRSFSCYWYRRQSRYLSWRSFPCPWRFHWQWVVDTWAVKDQRLCWSWINELWAWHLKYHRFSWDHWSYWSACIDWEWVLHK